MPFHRSQPSDLDLDFLDYYFDLLTYVGSRQNRLNAFKAEVPPPPATDEESYNQMWQKYTGRERANLRKRRVRLRHADFQILTQVGQGGYGQVYLAKRLGSSSNVPASVCIKVSTRMDGWLREAYFGQQLGDDPRALRIYDAFPLPTDEGRLMTSRPPRSAPVLLALMIAPSAVELMNLTRRPSRTTRCTPVFESASISCWRSGT